jgi:CheY-like chemotaxis protein
VILMAGLTCRCTWPDQHEALTVSQPGETDQGAPVTDPSARIVDVLLVEDDPGDVLMTREAFDEHLHNRLDVVGDGAEALAYLRHEPPYTDVSRPDLILLDLNLPRRDGPEVLQELKNDPDPKHIPVIVLTTSDDGGDILRSYQLHANAYVTKPMDFNDFAEAISQIDNSFGGLVKLPRTP